MRGYRFLSGNFLPIVLVTESSLLAAAHAFYSGYARQALCLQVPSGPSLEPKTSELETSASLGVEELFYLPIGLYDNPETDPPEAMKTLTIELSDKTAERLESLADQLGMSLEELAQLSLDDQMKRLRQEYDEAAEQVLSKNAELYRRLS